MYIIFGVQQNKKHVRYLVHQRSTAAVCSAFIRNAPWRSRSRGCFPLFPSQTPLFHHGPLAVCTVTPLNLWNLFRQLSVMELFPNHTIPIGHRHSSGVPLLVVSCLFLLLISFVHVEAQCPAGFAFRFVLQLSIFTMLIAAANWFVLVFNCNRSGASGLTCAPCKAGYYCPTGSLNIYGETGVGTIDVFDQQPETRCVHDTLSTSTYFLCSFQAILQS
jgi:hypothetical protein